MAYEFRFKPLNLCLPLSRKQLLSDVLEKQLYGDITDIWHHPGHIFITTDGGRKLFTFDCIPVHPQNTFNSCNLDVQNSSSPIVNVILISPSIATMVLRNGSTQWWRYTEAFEWFHIGNMELCSLVNSSVVDITYITASKLLVWCEKNITQTKDSSESSNLLDKSGSSFCVNGKLISVSDITANSLRELEVTANVTLVTNCPACSVFPVISDKIFLRSKVEKEQVSVSLVFNAGLEDGSMFIGKEKFVIPTSGNILDFRSILLKQLSIIIKMELNYGDLGIRLDKNRLVALSSCGLIEVFDFPDGSKNKIDHHVIPLSLGELPIQSSHWFLHKNHVGIFFQQSLCLYSIIDGTCNIKWMSNDLSDITQVAPSSSPAFLAWTLTPKGLLALQATNTKLKTAYTSVDTLPDDSLLETSVLQLCHLQQLKHDGYDKSVCDKLDMLKKVWNEERGSHQSQIVDMLAPLLDQYWKLDDVSKVFVYKKEQSQDDIDKKKFTEELSKVSSLPRRSRESKLLWLSQIYPQELLNSLCQGITLDCEDVIESELPTWQSLLGIEGWDLSKFELVCRLLFQHQPEKLYHFVKCAESVSEQTVGVSAFVRKKHSLIFYNSAIECLPLAETSCNPPAAAAAQGKLILACGSDNSVEQSLKHLLRHQLWQEAIDLLKTQSTNSEQLPSYMYIAMSSMAQNHSLTNFIPDLFSLMPSWKSFLCFSQVASLQPEIRQCQLSTSASDLFCHDKSDASIGDVKPFLLELIKKMDEKY